MNIPKLLKTETLDFIRNLEAVDSDGPFQNEVVESRFDCMKFAIQTIERDSSQSPADLDGLRIWFRERAAPTLFKSRMIKRATDWPEGYPGDYLTLEAVYENKPQGICLAAYLDRYFLSRMLAVAVRSRLRKLTADLVRIKSEETTGNWLNIACGSCRELLPIQIGDNDRIIHCVDSDSNALAYARELVAFKNLDAFLFHTENAFRLVSARRNVERFGKLAVIYSAGLFDYIKSDQLVRVLAGLYGSLGENGILIAPFKDARKYETFDYHWCVKWDFFIQRTEEDYRQIFSDAGIPTEKMTVERDASGVILFFYAKR